MIQFTKYEQARIIGARALQIAMGAPILISLSPEEIESIKFSPIEIAKRELAQQALPLTVKRPLPSKI